MTAGGAASIPLELMIWDAGECAEYLRQTRPYFLRATRYAKGFPKQLPISEETRPKWRAQDVIDWALGRRTSP